MKLRASGKIEASKPVHELTTSTPTRANEYREAYKKYKEEQSRKMSCEDALALLVDAKLSRHQYNLIRKSDPERFPSYTLLQLEKMKCYPNSESIVTSRG